MLRYKVWQVVGGLCGVVGIGLFSTGRGEDLMGVGVGNVLSLIMGVLGCVVFACFMVMEWRHRS